MAYIKFYLSKEHYGQVVDSLELEIKGILDAYNGVPSYDEYDMSLLFDTYYTVTGSKHESDPSKTPEESK